MISDTQTDRSPGVVSLCSVIWQAAGQFSSPQLATSAGLLPFFSFGCQVSSLSLSADRLILPLISSCQACSACRRAGRPFLSFSYKSCAPLTGSPFLSSVVFVLLSVCMFSVPSVLVSELADCKAIMLMHKAGTHSFPHFADSFPMPQLPG